MCLVLFASGANPLYRLVLAANRDEFHARPTAPAGAWPEVPGLFAGRDLQGGGTWLGVKDDGRLAALTNYRDRGEPKAPRSRGELVAGFLEGDDAPLAYFDRIGGRRRDYNGFNLIAGVPESVWIYSSRAAAAEPVPPGIHGVSNHLLDTPWPKVTRSKEALARLFGRGDSIDVEEVFGILGDRTTPSDEDLPDTGVGKDLERFLSPPFIVGRDYGTRSSSVVFFRRPGGIEFHERTFDADGRGAGTVSRLMGLSRCA